MFFQFGEIKGDGAVTMSGLSDGDRLSRSRRLFAAVVTGRKAAGQR
jgi:hypothetical protein